MHQLFVIKLCKVDEKATVFEFIWLIKYYEITCLLIVIICMLHVM